MCDPQSTVMGLMKKLRDTMRIEDELRNQLSAAGIDTSEKMNNAMIALVNAEAAEKYSL